MCPEEEGRLHRSVWIHCTSCDERLYGAVCSYYYNNGVNFICWKPRCIKKKKKLDASVVNLIPDSRATTLVAPPFQTAKTMDEANKSIANDPDYSGD